MGKAPAGREVICPDCGASAIAVVPSQSTIVQKEEAADGKVWVNCHDCGERFLAYFQIEADD